MYESLIKEYLRYATSPEAHAVLFVKKYLIRADTRVWVDVARHDAPPGYATERLQFRRVDCELFPRLTRPDYPRRSDFETEDDYMTACQAATWAAARRDIETARGRGRRGPRYRIRGALVRRATRPDEFFVPDTPDEIRALARDLSDRTDPLWDLAMQYVNPAVLETHEFRITYVRRLN